MAKKRSIRALGMILALMLTFSAIVTGCSKSGSSGNDAATSTSTTATASTAQTEELQPVTLSWYVAAAEVQNDLASVEEEVNKILNSKINATLKINMFDYGSYDQKMQLKSASGEEFDLCFTSYKWLQKYLENVAKGAFTPLDDLLAKYAPEYYASIPEKYWETTRVDGKIYAALNYQVSASAKGLMVQKSLADKYGFDYENLKSIDEVDAFLGKVKAGEPEIIPFGADKLGAIELACLGKDQQEYWDALVSSNLHIALKVGDKDYKLQNLEDSEYRAFFEEAVNIMRDWYNKGYLRKDVASVENVNQELAGGKYAVWPATYKPGGDAELSGKYGFEIVQTMYMKPIATAGSIMATMTAISKSSKNPERAMMLLNLVNTDKDLFNLLSYGIENKHYKKVADNTVERIENGGYWPNAAWAFGNQFNAYLIKGMSENVWDETKRFNEEAVLSPLTGFNPNVDSLKSIIANVNAVSDEIRPGLITGTLDPAKNLPIFYDKMKKADPEGKVKAELQKQVDEWATANNKK